MYRTFLALVSAALLAGCSSTAINSSQAKPVPAERQIATTFFQQHDGAQAITLIRDGGLFGSARYTSVWIDGELTADLDTSEKVTVYLPSGQHLVTVGPKTIGGSAMAATIMVTPPSKTTMYRISETTGGRAITPIQ